MKSKGPWFIGKPHFLERGESTKEAVAESNSAKEQPSAAVS